MNICELCGYNKCKPFVTIRWPLKDYGIELFVGSGVLTTSFAALQSPRSPPLIECAARSRVIDHFQTFWISRKWDAVEFLSTPMLVHHTQRWNQTGTKGIHTHWERERERESEWNNRNSGMQMSFSVDASSYANQRPFTSLFIPFVCYTTWTDFAIQLYLNWLVGRRLMTSISLSLSIRSLMESFPFNSKEKRH